MTTTDFQGHYRFQRVQPGGPYALLSRISPRAFAAISDEPAEMDQRLPAIMPVYYMNSRYPDGALTVSPSPGQKIEGLDIQIERVKAYCAEGVAQAEGKPAQMYLEIDDSGMISSPKLPEIMLGPAPSAQRSVVFRFNSKRVQTG